MKILWVCNVGLRCIDTYLKKDSNLFIGGWLEGLSTALVNDVSNELVYCYPDYKSKVVRNGRVDNLIFYSLPMMKQEAHTEIKDSSVSMTEFVRILEKEKPDLLHFFGTEFVYTERFIDAAIRFGYGNRIVTSIQGLIGIYGLHYDADLPYWVTKIKTLTEIKNRNSLAAGKADYLYRGLSEKKALEKSKYIIGRTSWDKACAKILAPNSVYLLCNETLRDCFYTGEWHYKYCNKYQIAISQAATPIKGLHKVIEAAALIREQYPKLRIVVSGNNIFSGNWIKGNTYGNYIRWLVKKNGLENNIDFIGGISAEKMRDMMLSSNVFVCPSSIENSPNSLGEAMLLGVPCVASDVGGTADMMRNGTEGFIYPFNEHYKLAYHLDYVFSHPEEISKIALAAKEHARNTHSQEKNNQRLMSIYHQIISEALV